MAECPSAVRGLISPCGMCAQCVEAERDDLRARVAELEAIIAGRAEAPTDAEIAAHAAAGGSWIVARRMNGRPFAEVLRTVCMIDRRRRMGGAQRWVPVVKGVPCAWPVAP